MAKKGTFDKYILMEKGTQGKQVGVSCIKIDMPSQSGCHTHTQPMLQAGIHHAGLSFGIWLAPIHRTNSHVIESGVSRSLSMVAASVKP